MTDVEYEQARAQMLGQARADVAAVAAPGRREDQTGAAQPPADAPAPGAAGPTDKSTP
jgi:hypothetical protein